MDFLSAKLHTTTTASTVSNATTCKIFGNTLHISPHHHGDVCSLSNHGKIVGGGAVIGITIFEDGCRFESNPSYTHGW